jgi:menaquinone-specific isochorismate synthase
MIAPEQLDYALKELSAQPQHGYRQVIVPISSCDPLQWLAQQPCRVRGYWRNKSGEQVAFVGNADHLIGFEAFNRACHHLDPSNDQIRLYGGIAFSEQSAQWLGFPHYQFVLPRFELRIQPEQSYFVINACWEPSSDARHNNASNHAQLQQIRAEFAQLKAPKPLSTLHCTPIDRTDTPDFNQWRNQVEQVVGAPFQSHTAKVVLARRSRIRYTGNLDPFSLLDEWQQHEAESFSFLFQFDGVRTFLGCSPERLYRRLGSELLTEALAGTAARGATPLEDDNLADQLLSDHKNQTENQLVVDDLICRLQALSLSVHAEPSPELVKLDRVQHLRKTLKATINPDLRDCDLLTDLHPTPAVGGTPRASALHYIHRHEHFHRGWYAGAVGSVSGHCSEFSVAIRSALMEPGHLDAFAGAGIVQGSNPDAEWQELNNKIATLLSLIDDENQLL